GCPQCDTDYSLDAKKSVKEIVSTVASLAGTTVDWVWITGGEPTYLDLQPLIDQLYSVGLRVALATAGTRSVKKGRYYEVVNGKSVWNAGYDFVSVSPHR